MRLALGDPVIRLAFALSLGACAAATQRAYVAPTGETIVSETDERSGDPPVHVITVRNLSTVPVTVFSVSLTRCENVKQSCGPRRTNLRVGPGQSVTAMRVEPQNLNSGFSYYFGFSWNADSSSSAALAALAATADANRLRELTRDDFRALASRAALLRADPESLILAPGEQARLDRIRLLLVDNQDKVLGFTRWVSWNAPSSRALQFVPPNLLIAKRPTRASVRFMLAQEAQSMLSNTMPEILFPIVVAYRIEPHAPLFSGRALDADSKMPLICARVGLEDSVRNVVNASRTDATGSFTIRAPRPGSYRVRVETHGWVPAYGPMEVAKADAERNAEYAVRFTEQLLETRDPMSEDQRARPAAVSTMPIGARPGARPSTTPIVQGVTLGGSETTPILGIISRLPPLTLWMQFVVDSTGRVDTTSIILPPGTTANAKASVLSVLPRVRFSPATEAGKPTCELLRMQVNFSPR